MHFLPFALRPEDKAMYSPKRSTKAESKDGQPFEESEILISKAPRKTREPSLFLALCRTFGPYFLVSAVYKIVHDVLMFAGPKILRLLSALAVTQRRCLLSLAGGKFFEDSVGEHRVLERSCDLSDGIGAEICLSTLEVITLQTGPADLLSRPRTSRLLTRDCVWS